MLHLVLELEDLHNLKPKDRGKAHNSLRTIFQIYKLTAKKIVERPIIHLVLFSK
jgi:hypothetical protein